MMYLSKLENELNDIRELESDLAKLTEEETCCKIKAFWQVMEATWHSDFSGKDLQILHFLLIMIIR